MKYILAFIFALQSLCWSEPLLVAYWAFESNAGNIAVDSSSHQYNGSVSGAQVVTGAVGNAYEFNGTTNHVNLAADPIFDGYTSFTVQAWVRPYSKNNTEYPTIIEKYAGASSYDMPWVGYYEGNDQWGWEITTNASENVYRHTGISVSFGVWSHVVYSIDIASKVGKFYLNGQLRDTYNMSISGTKMSSNPGGLIDIADIEYISRTHAWKGTIDELAVWNGALNADQVHGLYLSGVQIPEPSIFYLMALGCLAYILKTKSSARAKS
ncbi:MAG: LamG domain-containing protein [Candidatus Brocadiae bacterium]|nr:LamG domain-containing protein [Candidatus Brocadiia bacterium]